MKKFYEAPVVELTGFSAEDVITTSVATIYNTATDGIGDAQAFEAAVAAKYGANVKIVDYTGKNESYQW